MRPSTGKDIREGFGERESKNYGAEALGYLQDMREWETERLCGNADLKRCSYKLHNTSYIKY